MLERIADPREVRRWDGGMPVAHRYTPGVAGSAFFEALRDRGVFLGSRCRTCAYTYVPVRAFCERCFAALAADTEVGPAGVLRSFAIGFTDLEGRALDEPVTVGLVQLDGADAVLLHRLVDTGDEPLAIGSRVEAVLRPSGERIGSIDDVVGFRLDARSTG